MSKKAIQTKEKQKRQEQLDMIEQAVSVALDNTECEVDESCDTEEMVKQLENIKNKICIRKPIESLLQKGQ